MIKYDPHDWLNHLFDIQGSVIREITGRLLLFGAWSIVAVGASEIAGRANHSLAIPETGHTLVGVALGLLLVLRTNASYDRYWEGRRQWGSIVNSSRNLARTASVYLAGAPELVRALLAWTAAFSRATMHHLRGTASLGDQPSDLPGWDLPGGELQKVLSEGRVPLAVSRRMTAVIAAGHERRLISDIQQATLDQNVQQLVDALGSCERIHNTPMPFAYVVHLRRALILYLLTLPFALVGRFGWLTVPAVVLIAYNILGIEEIGVEIEDPFGEQKNDLPLVDFCATIDGDLRAIAATLPPSQQ
jgi:putative membrane protein